MKYISASTSLESILDAFSTESESVLPKEKFKGLKKEIESMIVAEVGKQLQKDDVESMLRRVPEINRRSYRKKAERLLESLGMLDGRTKELLKDIVTVRDQITHKGRFINEDLDMKKVAQTYLELYGLLTKIFLEILIPEDPTFYQEFLNKTWNALV